MKKLRIISLLMAIVLLGTSFVVSAETGAPSGNGLEAPVVTSVSESYNKNKIMWNAIEGALGYQIYRSEKADTGYARIITVKSPAVSYVDADENIKCGRTYYYKVRAYCKDGEENVFGAFSEVCAHTTSPAKAIIKSVARVDYDSLKVSWNKVAGAKGFLIYRSKSLTGTYKKVWNVKSGSKLYFTDNDCVCGQRYYYKVKAYRTINGKTFYGELSDAATNYTKPDKININSETSYNSTKMKLQWDKAGGASGYEVYRSTKKSSGYKKVATLVGRDKNTWTNKNLKKGKVYYYKVRAYRQLKSGAMLYGAYSKAFKKTKAGWRYVDGYKLYYNTSGKLVKDVSKRIGPQDSYVIKVNKQMNTVTVYAKDGKNGYIIPVKAFVCSVGYDTPIGTFRTPHKYRWHELMGPCWGQWCTRITGGILFHSVWYSSTNNNNTLSVSSYNKLGSIASHGCVRLTAGDAKWIYDNCDLGTKVVIYNDSNPGPLGKPTAHKLESWHTWDPTDPNMKKKCKEKGCH